MRQALSILLVLVIFSVQAADLTQLMQQAKANPQAQLDSQLSQPAKTAQEHFLLAYSHYALKNKEAALEISNKAMTLEPDTELAGRILLMQALIYGVFYRDTAMAIEKLTLADTILPDEETPKILSVRMDILESFAQAYNQLGNAELAMKAATKSLALATKAEDKQRKLDAMLMLGRIHLQNNNLSKAYQYFKSALALAAELDDQQAIASISMRLGMAYQKLQQHELALQYFIEATRLYQQLGNLSSQVNALINSGDSQLVLKQLDNAKATYNKALKLAVDSKDTYMLLSANVSLSELALEQGDLEQAEQLLTKAHQLASQVSVPSVKAETALFLANIFIKKQNYKAAKTMLAEAAPEPDKLPAYLKSKHLALNAELAALEQQWQQAYQLEKTANQLEVAKLNDTSKIQLDNLQSSLELQLHQEKQQELHIRKQTQLQQWLLISLALLAFVLFGLLLLLSKQKKSRTSAVIPMTQWRSFTELLLHHHRAKTQGQLLMIMPTQTQVLLEKGIQQVGADLEMFRARLDQAMFWTEHDQEFWLYCTSQQQAGELQQQLLQSLPAAYQAHSAVLPLHELLSERICEQDLDAMRELVWYSLYLAGQQGLQGALQLTYQCHQHRPCAWQGEQLRQDLFNAISLGLLEIQANGVSLSASLQQQLAHI